MQKPIDLVKFGTRVRELREERGWSQTKLGKESGQSQSNIGWIEQGNAKKPRKQALSLAEALGTTADWLLYETGKKHTALLPLTRKQLTAVYDDLPLSVQMMITDLVEGGGERKRAPK